MVSLNAHPTTKTSPGNRTIRRAATPKAKQISENQHQQATTLRKRSVVDQEETYTRLKINAVVPGQLTERLERQLLVFHSNCLATEASKTHPPKAHKVADKSTEKGQEDEKIVALMG